MTTLARESATHSWQEANYRYLLTEMKRLRLVLHRSVLWLRTQWKQDPLQNYQESLISNELADRLLQGDQPAERARFHAHDPAALQLARALASVEHDLVLQFEDLDRRGQRPAIDLLVHVCQLTPFARDLLLLCLAPHLDPAFERLYGYAQDDVTRQCVTAFLAFSLFAPDEASILQARESLLPHMPLRRLRLISHEREGSAGQSYDALRLAERTRDYLLGVNRIDERVGAWLQPMTASLLTPSHETLVGSIAAEVRAGAAVDGWPLINLVGAAGSGTRSVAKAICEKLRLSAFELNSGWFAPRHAEREEDFRLLEREALLSQFAVYIDASAFETEPLLKSGGTDAVGRLELFRIVHSRERLPVNSDALVIPVPDPTAEAQDWLWRRALAAIPNGVGEQVTKVTQQFDFSPSTISRVVTSALRHARMAGGPDAIVSMQSLWAACRSEARTPLDTLAQPISVTHTWEDIVLPADVLRQLEEISAQVALRAKVYESWGFGATLGRGRGVSALLFGPSGTGKTMAAEILANELQLDLFRIDLSGVVSKYIGETEKNLRRVFEAAEESGAILFFDEADALFGKRSEVRDSHDRYANIEVNYLLQRMETYRGLAILATNMKSHLDPAFLRRLRFVVELPFPDAEHRARIWRKVFPSAAPLQDLDYRLLSRLEITGGNIKNIAVNAAFLASREDRAISMTDVIRAARREYAKLERIPMEAEFGAFHDVICR
jgi:hypothetical protein